MPKKQRASHDADILRGIARGPWADAWAQEQEEKGESFSGMDIYEAAPEAPRWAERWAKRLADAIVEINQTSLSNLYSAVKSAGFARDEEAFGFYLGMQSVGHGISWDDDVSTDLKIGIPSMEFYESAKPDMRFISR